MNKFSAFLLSYLKYGDNDAILHCYTKENGFQSFFLKGVYTSKNKKKAYLVPLNELLITTVENAKSTELLLVKKIESIENSFSDYDVKISSLTFFVSDFLHQILKNEHQNLFLYSKIKEIVFQISKGNSYSHYFFFIDILKIFGISPLSQKGDFLNVTKGEFQEMYESDTLDKEISIIWKFILNEDYTDFKIKKESRKKLLDSIILYYKIHFPDFYTPKSLPVLVQIFE